MHIADLANANRQACGAIAAVWRDKPMSTPQYSRASIEEFADKIRSELGLVPPITASDIKRAYEKLGIKLTSRRDCSLDSNIRRLAPFDYEVFYDPEWSDQTFVWNMSTVLGHILLYDIYQDGKKHVYTGRYQCLTSAGYHEDINKVIKNVNQFEDDIIRCEDASDLRDIIRENIDRQSYQHCFVQCMYDFYTDTLIRIQICGGGQDYEYYIRFPKKQENAF